MAEMVKVANGFRTVEGPTLAPDGSLYFGDVRGGGVHRLWPDGTIETVVAKRRGVGGTCLHADGGIVVSGRDVSHVKDGRTRVILAREDVAPADGTTVGGFNDIGADPQGRIFAGVQRMTPDGGYGRGSIVMITGEHAVEAVFEGVLPNGNAVSPDGTTLYQVDSTGRRVIVFALGDGTPTVVRQFSTESLPGVPDGAATDEHGNLWIAFHHGGCVAQLDPEGHVRQRIDFPTPTVTSLCFGAPGSGHLFVVTEEEGDSDDPQGCIYRLDVDVAGAPVHPATV